MSYCIIEYAKAGQGFCKAPKNICHSANRRITEGELRFGTEFPATDRLPLLQGYTWRHWTCVSAVAMEKLKDAYSDFSEIHGFDKLREKDQNQIKIAWEEEGKISEDDEPRSTAENKSQETLPAANNNEEAMSLSYHFNSRL